MRRYTRGFNLLELMVAIAIAGILLGVGIPSFTEFIRNSRMTAAANDMLAGLYAARSEAIKRRAFVGFCLSEDPDAAAPVCAAGTDPINGWFVWVDDDEVVDATTAIATDLATDGDGDFDAVPGEEVLLTGVIRDTITATPDTSLVLYGFDGFARATKGGAASARQVVLCDVRKNVASIGGNDVSAARAVAITVTGRASVTRSKTAIENTFGGCP